MQTNITDIKLIDVSVRKKVKNWIIQETTHWGDDLKSKNLRLDLYKSFLLAVIQPNLKVPLGWELQLSQEIWDIDKKNGFYRQEQKPISNLDSNKSNVKREALQEDWATEYNSAMNSQIKLDTSDIIEKYGLTELAEEAIATGFLKNNIIVTGWLETGNRLGVEIYIKQTEKYKKYFTTKADFEFPSFETWFDNKLKSEQENGKL